MKIDIAREFSPYPSGRTEQDGDANGKKFRERFLVPALRRVLANSASNEKLILDIDGVRTFGSSFLDEAIGGIVRNGDFPRDRLRSAVRVHCTRPYLMFFKDEIESYLN
jgi:hypothetical protein